MKKLRKINLNQLNKAELSERELNRLLGGANCCVCHGRGSVIDGIDVDTGIHANLKGGMSGLIPTDGGGGIGAGSFSR